MGIIAMTRLWGAEQMGTNDELQDHLVLKYQGPRVEKGALDARQVASHILAFTDFLDVVSEATYGQKVHVNTEVQGFRGDSFDIDFVFQIAGHVATILTSTAATPRDIIGIIKSSAALWVHLRGKPPKAVTHAQDNAQQLLVENVSGDVYAVNNSVLQVVINQRAGEATEKFIGHALKCEGIEKVEVRSKTFGDAAYIEKRNGSYFVPVSMVQELSVAEVEMALTIESPTFKEGNKWRFWDGQVSFGADMADEDYLRAINDGTERFGKGDILRVRMQISQAAAPGRLSADRKIVKVLEHRLGQEQKKLL